MRLNASEKSADGMVSIKAFYKNSKLNTNIEEAALTGSMFIGELGGVLGWVDLDKVLKNKFEN